MSGECEVDGRSQKKETGGETIERNFQIQMTQQLCHLPTGFFFFLLISDRSSRDITNKHLPQYDNHD